ncbi:MAG: glycosyltransferase [Candidatus Cloacimonas sp.]|nr:glycosyltransferase [Candidatus Cloacimonas sp.]
MKKKGYYIFSENYGSDGVKKKIQMQVETFSQFVDISLLQIKDVKVNYVFRIINLLPWRSFPRDYNATIENMENPDFVYVRRILLDREFLFFLKTIKEKWSCCKVIIEIPVYPYKKGMLRNPYLSIQYVKEVLYRKHYEEVVDRFVTYSSDKRICNVETIRTMNGVNLACINANRCSNEYKPNEINLIAVATFLPHHGYERVIQGLHNYYIHGGIRQFTIHFVGDGLEKNKYERLVSKYSLNKYIVFHGFKYGNELDNLYNNADAGLVSFGSYKEKVERLCTIKTREYLAKGLPVILGGIDELFEKSEGEYALCFSNDASPIDFERIGRFLDGLYLGRTKQEVIFRIRCYAKENVDNSVTLKPIIEYIYS